MKTKFTNEKLLRIKLLISLKLLLQFLHLNHDVILIPKLIIGFGMYSLLIFPLGDYFI